MPDLKVCVLRFGSLRKVAAWWAPPNCLGKTGSRAAEPTAIIVPELVSSQMLIFPRLMALLFNIL